MGLGDDLFLATTPRQREKTTASRYEAGQASADDRAGHAADAVYRDAARIRKTHRAGVHPVGAGRAGERHENIAVERIYRDRMRTCGHRQIDGLGNGAGGPRVGDHVEEPSAVGAIITGDVERVCLRVVPQLVCTTEPGERLDDRAFAPVARGIEQDRSRPHVAAANH